VAGSHLLRSAIYCSCRDLTPSPSLSLFISLSLCQVPFPTCKEPPKILQSPCTSLHPWFLLLQLQELHLRRKTQRIVPMLTIPGPSLCFVFFSLSLCPDQITPLDSSSDQPAANPSCFQKTSSNSKEFDGALVDISKHSCNPTLNPVK